METDNYECLLARPRREPRALFITNLLKSAFEVRQEIPKAARVPEELHLSNSWRGLRLIHTSPAELRSGLHFCGELAE